MNSRIPRFSAAALLCMSLLSACGNDVKDSLGINKKAPDEFKVVSRPPLSVPPEFSLTPPISGVEAQEFSSASKNAQSLVFGKDEESDDALGQTILRAGTAETAVTPVTTSTLGSSSAESQFLLNAGADQANSNVRNEIYSENRARESSDDSIIDTLTSIPEKSDPIVKAQEEAERIKTNQEQGKPITEGETPETTGTDRGILGKIMGY